MLGKKMLLAIVVLATTLVAEGAARAANANFQGDCTNSSGSPTSCEFSPNKAPAGEPFTGCNGAGVSYYYWTFGDGNYYYTYPTVDFGRAYHTYAAGSLSVTVQLAVGCNNGVVVSNSHCLKSTPTTGCIIVNGGWSPY
jgi:hypothetical protein